MNPFVTHRQKVECLRLTQVGHGATLFCNWCWGSSVQAWIDQPSTLQKFHCRHGWQGKLQGNIFTPDNGSQTMDLGNNPLHHVSLGTPAPLVTQLRQQTEHP